MISENLDQTQKRLIFFQYHIKKKKKMISTLILGTKVRTLLSLTKILIKFKLQISIIQFNHIYQVVLHNNDKESSDI